MKRTFFATAFFALFFALGCGNESAPNQENGHSQPSENTASQSGETGSGGAAIPEEKPVELPEEPAEKPAETSPEDAPEPSPSAKDRPTSAPAPKKKGVLDAADWTEVSTLDRSIAIDIRYATTDNLTKSKIYDCPRCFLRPEAAKAIVAAHKKLKINGLGLKMFDCYRPRPYQQRLWDKVPNPDYVTPPGKGSMHSRGAAVDLTIVDKNGKELDMGTTYDFFGEKAHADFTDLPEKVLQNRRLLKKTMESVGFRGIRTEWWHFSFGKKEFELSSELWDCDSK